MTQKLRNREKGFTIIEVLIVLAIAGLILLIVFLAVPALQRNARNTSRKDDVAALLGAISEFENNNGGQLPAVACPAGAGPYTLYTGTCGAQTGTGAAFKTGFYNTAAPTFAAGAQGALPGTAAGDKMVVVTSAACGNAGATVAGSGRQVAVQYEVEGSGTFVPACQDE